MNQLLSSNFSMLYFVTSDVIVIYSVQKFYDKLKTIQ